MWEGHKPLGVAASGQWQWRGGRRARPCAVSSSACVQGGGAGWAGGPGDINIRGQARPVICPDLEHDVQSESTGAHGLRRSPVRLGGACRHHPQAPTAVLIIRNCPAWRSTAEQGPARPGSSALTSPWEGLSTPAPASPWERPHGQGSPAQITQHNTWPPRDRTASPRSHRQPKTWAAPNRAGPRVYVSACPQLGPAPGPSWCLPWPHLTDPSSCCVRKAWGRETGCGASPSCPSPPRSLDPRRPRQTEGGGLHVGFLSYFVALPMSSTSPLNPHRTL